MKKALLLCIIALSIPAYILFERFSKNPISVIPFPYKIEENLYKNNDSNATIVILGDSQAQRLSLFKSNLVEALSQKLTKDIEIEVLASNNESIFRSLEKLKRRQKAPLIILYMGNMDTSYEKLFNNYDISNIHYNLSLYKKDLVRSLLMFVPEFSQFIYKPIDRHILTQQIEKNSEKYEDNIFQKRQMTFYKFYEMALNEIISYAKKRGSVLIPITTPVNLLKSPKKSCYASLSTEGVKDLIAIKKLLKKKDYKSALNLSKDLALLNSSNAQALFIYGLVAKKMNLKAESQKYLERAHSYDCKNTKANPIYNAILKKKAREHDLEYFDFHQFLVDESYSNTTFIDDIYPQDFYMEKTVDLLAIKIKKLLKL